LPEGVEYSIEEWWDTNGDHHEGEPTERQLLDDARQLTVRLIGDEGREKHFTAFSPDGWEREELDVEVEDAAGYYELVA
jgi:hypothetical protein